MEIGEIWVSGSTVAQGYWNQMEATQQTFQAYLKDREKGPFLRTGDLGFIKEGQLFVTGRMKDVIIIRGRNHYPQDIERIAEQSHEAIIPDHSAAFTVEIKGEDKLVVVSEVERRYRVRRQSSSSLSESERRRQNDRRKREYPLPSVFEVELHQKPIFQEVAHKIREGVSRYHGLQVYAIGLLQYGSIPKTSSGKIQRYACRQGFMERKLNLLYSDM
jgi:acyl-CoA synthetase (AMP-forming)/AMP-acid ligase II